MTKGIGQYAVSNRRASGTLSAASTTLAINCEGAGTVHYEIDAGLSGTSAVYFQGTLDDSTWFTVYGVDLVGLLVLAVPQAALPARGSFIVSGFSQVRLLLVDGADSSAARLAASFSTRIVTLGGIQLVDGTTFAPGVNTVLPLGARYDSAGASVDDGDIGIPRMSANRNLFVNIQDAAGNERGVNVDASNQAGVVEANSGGIKTAVEAVSTALDTAGQSATGKEGLLLHGRTAADARYPLKITADGELQVDIPDGVVTLTNSVTQLTDGTDQAVITPAGELNVLETNSGNTKTAVEAIQTAVEILDDAISGSEMQVDVVNNPEVVGNVAHDAAASGNPVTVAGASVSTAANLSSPVSAAGDVTRLACDKFGALIVRDEVNVLHALARKTGTTSDTDLIAAQGSGKYIVLHQLDVTCDNDNTNDTTIKVAFASTATEGDNFVYWKCPAGGGLIKPMHKHLGGDNEALKLNCTDPGGAVTFSALYSVEDHN